jgi:putative transposase
MPHKSRGIFSEEDTSLRGRRPLALCLEEAFQHELEALVRRHTTPQQIVLCARIILLAHQEQNNQQIAQHLGIGVDTARHWRGRWVALQAIPLSEMSVTARLADAPRPGAPATISAEAYCQIMALACQPPENWGRPITHWTERELAEEAIKQQIVETISPRQVGRFLKSSHAQAALVPLLADQRK